MSMPIEAHTQEKPVQIVCEPPTSLSFRSAQFGSIIWLKGKIDPFSRKKMINLSSLLL